MQLYGVLICGVVPLAHAAHVVACGRVDVCSAPHAIAIGSTATTKVNILLAKYIFARYQNL